MTRLDWKNVANPDFTAAAALQQSASRDIAKAFTGIGTFVDGVANRNNAQNQKALELAKIRYLDNPTGLRKAVIGGEFDDLLSARDISGQDVAGMRTTADDYLMSLQGHRSDERAEDVRARRLAARPDMVNSILAQQRGDHAGSDRIIQESDAIRNLDFSDVDGLINDVTAGGQTYRTESSSRKSFAEDRMVEQVLASLDYNNMSAESKLLDLDAAYNNGNSRMPAGVYNRIRSTLLGGAPAAGGGMGGVAAPATGGFLGSGSSASLGSMPTGSMKEEDYFSDDLTPYETGLFNAEASNNPSVKNADSSATGLAQFTTDTFLGVIKNYFPEIAKGKSDDEIAALRTDPDISKKAAVALRKENASALQRNGIPLNEETMYLAHHFNPTRAAEIYGKRSPNILMDDLLTPEELAANKTYRGKTYGEVSSEWGRRFAAGRGVTPAQAVAQGQLVNDDAHSASAAAVGSNRSYLELQADKRSFADVVNDELKEGGRLAGADRGAVNDAMRRIRDLIPKIEGANKEDVKVSEWKPTDAQLMDILISSLSGSENRSTLGSAVRTVLPFLNPAAYAAQSLTPEKYKSKVGLGDSEGAGKPGSLPLSIEEAQRLINQRYSSISDAGAQSARDIDAGIAKRDQLRAEVALLEQEYASAVRAADTPGKQREVARVATILDEKVAQLNASNAAGGSAPVKQDQAAAVRVDAERKQEEWDALEAFLTRELPKKLRGPRGNMLDERQIRTDSELFRDGRNF